MAAGTLQSEGSRVTSDRYHSTKTNLPSTINPSAGGSQDLIHQPAFSQFGSETGMNLMLFNSNASNQDVQSPIHPFEKEGSPSQIVRKRFKTADGNVIPLPFHVGAVHMPTDQLANSTINPIISFPPAISSAIQDPYQGFFPRAGDASRISGFWDQSRPLMNMVCLVWLLDYAPHQRYLFPNLFLPRAWSSFLPHIPVHNLLALELGTL